MCRRKPPPAADAPAQKRSGVLTGVSSLPLCAWCSGSTLSPSTACMNWMVAYGVDGSGPGPGLGGQVSFGVLWRYDDRAGCCLSPLVDKLGALKSLAAFGGASCVLYLIGSLGGAVTMPVWAISGLSFSILYPTLVMSIRLLFPGAAGLRRGGHDFKHRVAGGYPVQRRLRQAGGYDGLCRQHPGPAAVRTGIFHRVYTVYEILQTDAEIEIK